MEIREITLKNIKAFIQGYFRKFLLDKLTYIYEQVEYRKEQVAIKSPDCLNGQCVKCGCKTPELFYADKPCENKCYDELKSKEDWIKFKNILSC